MICLYDWQKECIEKWFANRCRGIVNVATGAGKTILAAASIKKLEERLKNKNLKVKIVVPKIFLAGQWMNVLIETLGIKRGEIGLYYGKIKESESRRYMIYVLNSARYSLSSHILNDFRDNHRVLLICDECHRFGSSENAKVFDFMPYIPDSFYYSMGLSATPVTDNPALAKAIGNEIYRYGFDAAVEKQIVSEFDVFNINLDFLAEESEEYYELSDKLNKLFTNLLKLKPYLKKYRDQKFYAELHKIAAAKTDKASEYAALMLITVYKRKEVVYLAENRILCALELLKRLTENKIIVFGERISAVDALYGRLKDAGVNAVRYHSNMGDEARRFALEQYRNGEANILLSCRALDEGFNVPETDTGIIMSSTGSIRQRIQRVGRVLRKSGRKCKKSIYYMYVGDSSEECEILPNSNSSRTFNLYYSAKQNNYTNDEYDSLCGTVLKRLAENKTSPLITDEVKNNFNLGIIKSDWRLSESECREKINESKNNSEKNYWISMLKLAEQYKSTP